MFQISSSTVPSSSVSFGPARLDIQWDGVSNGKITVAPSCIDTSTTATYSLQFLHVNGEDAEVLYRPFSGPTADTEEVKAGGPYFQDFYPDFTGFFYATPFSVGNTTSSTGEVSFELIPSDTNYTAYYNTRLTSETPSQAHFTWKLTEDRGTATNLIGMGKLLIHEVNPYQSGSPSANMISSHTAHFCIG